MKISPRAIDIIFYGPYHLTAGDILGLREAGYIERLPWVTADEINTRSKSGAFSKRVAILQILWSTCQILTRAVRGLPISQLELSVIAFSLYAIIIYALEWSKPKDVTISLNIFQYSGTIPLPVWTLLRNLYFKSDRLSIFETIPIPFCPDDHLDRWVCTELIWNDNCWLNLWGKTTQLIWAFTLDFWLGASCLELCISRRGASHSLLQLNASCGKSPLCLYFTTGSQLYPLYYSQKGSAPPSFREAGYCSYRREDASLSCNEIKDNGCFV